MIILRLKHFIQKESERAVYIFHTLCQFKISQIGELWKRESGGSGSLVGLRMDSLEIIKNNFEKIKKILDFVYRVEVLCTSSISGKFPVGEVSLGQFEDLENLLDASEESLSRKQMKAHDSFSFVRLIQQVCQHVKRVTEINLCSL